MSHVPWPGASFMCESRDLRKSCMVVGQSYLAKATRAVVSFQSFRQLLHVLQRYFCTANVKNLQVVRQTPFQNLDQQLYRLLTNLCPIPRNVYLLNVLLSYQTLKDPSKNGILKAALNKSKFTYLFPKAILIEFVCLLNTYRKIDQSKVAEKIDAGHQFSLRLE